MAEYIDREAAINAATLAKSDADITLVPGSFTNGFIEGAKIKENAILNALADVPAADVVEVRRAAWQSWEQDKPPCKWYSCDYCGFHALSRSNYCPNCGADMREV